MKVLVCGSRHFTDAEIMDDVLKQWNIKEIIEGGAKGADRLASDWAKDNHVPSTRYPADWKTHGKAAGPIRNRKMLDDSKPDLVVAFLAPNSRGTKDMVNYAKSKEVEVYVVDVN